MGASTQTAENEELVIDTIEGLVDFFAYAQDAFADFKDSAAVCPSEEVCAPYLKQAEEAYEEIQSLVERHCKVLDLGGFLSEDDAEEIQALYNKIVSAQDNLESALASENKDAVEGDEGENIFNTETPAEADDEEETNYKEEPHSIFVTQAQGSLYITDETEPSALNVSIRQTSIDSEAFRRNLSAVKGRAEALQAQGEKLLHEYQEMSESTEEDTDFKDGVYLYMQLKANTDAVKNITATIAARMKAPVAEDAEVFLSLITDELHQYETNITQIDAGLAHFFDEPETASTVNEVEKPSEVEVLKAASDNHFESFRPNLFSKNEMRPAIEKALLVPEYKKFLSEYFTSPGAFEAYLRREINALEKISKFDSVFGIVRKSPFDSLLRDMSLKDLETFDHQPTESLRHQLLSKDIQYEMYVDWMHEYEAMKAIVHTTPVMTFGELYVRAIVEDLMDKQLEQAV